MGDHVFICYARQDQDFVLKLAANLKERGVPVWLDQWDITASADWDLAIDKALYDCAQFLIVLSPAARASREVRGELRTALNENKLIVPVLYQTCRIPRQLQLIQHVDFTSCGPDDGAALGQVLRALGVRVTPPEPVRPPIVKERPTVQGGLPIWGWGAVALVAALVIGGVIFLAIQGGKLTATSTPTPTERPIATPVPPTDTPTLSAPPVMVYVPAGEFTMGSDEGDSNEQPVHTVYLDAFYIDKYEVTNAQFAQFLNEQGNQEEGGVTWLDIGSESCLITQIGEQYQPKSGYDDHPVIEVSWYGARAYCLWASKRLPTEAEWEKAARGTDERTYPWGERVDCDHAQYNECEGETAPVGSKPKGASPYGALDMAGNVAEWVADSYGEDYYSQSPSRNPLGPGFGTSKVLRGGSWIWELDSVRCADRRGKHPGITDGTVGFRCARSSP